ncbi:hypothetical protein N9B73_04480 [Verrucomicrobiales bacterium]|nr:hypothetical protein [Verrucomicrobiales bacterium]
MMSPILKFKPVAFLVAVLLILSPGEGRSQEAVSYNDVARLFAGLPLSPGNPLEGLLALPSVNQHYAETSALTKTWRESRLQKIDAWSRAEIRPRIGQPAVMKYMFGGPDFVHAATMFPGIPEYILVGMEPLGVVPDFSTMNEAQLGDYLKHLNFTLRDISRRSFFITKDMRTDFQGEGVNGVFPILLYFAALTGHDVLEAGYVTLDSEGGVVKAAAEEGTGLWLRLRSTVGGVAAPEQNLYFFKTDLSNARFKPESVFKRFLDSRPGGVGYLKAASFLMQTEDFSNIRNFLVGDLDYILEDASGIPANFLELYYNVSYYGNYAGPIDMFTEYNQPRLHEIYQSGIAKPLPFGTGYRYKDEDSVQLFGIKK